MLVKNPAVGVKLPRKRAVKPTVFLPLVAIRRVLEVVLEPTRSMLILMVFASMRAGEVLALALERHPARTALSWTNVFTTTSSTT